MSLFGSTGQTNTFGSTSVFGTTGATSTNHNPMKDVEVTSPPDDSVSSMKFSPGVLPTTFLVAGSWDNNVSCGTFVFLYLAKCFVFFMMRPDWSCSFAIIITAV